MEKIKKGERGTKGRRRDREDDKNTLFAVLVCVLFSLHVSKSNWLLFSSSLYLSLPFASLPFIQFYIQTDMYKDLILDQLQQSNREGVKSYGLLPNDIIYI